MGGWAMITSPFSNCSNSDFRTEIGIPSARLVCAACRGAAAKAADKKGKAKQRRVVRGGCVGRRAGVDVTFRCPYRHTRLDESYLEVRSRQPQNGPSLYALTLLATKLA